MLQAHSQMKRHKTLYDSYSKGSKDKSRECGTNKQLKKLKINVSASKYLYHKMDKKSYKMLPEMYQTVAGSENEKEVC